MEKEESSPSTLVIVAFILGTAWLLNQAPKPNSLPDPTPQIAVSESVMELTKVADAGDPVAVKKLAALYSDFAEVLSRVEPGSLQSSQLRLWLIKSDTYLIRGTNLVGAVPGFGTAKDKVFTEALGMEDRPLDAKDLAAAVSACRSIAQALGAK